MRNLTPFIFLIASMACSEQRTEQQAEQEQESPPKQNQYIATYVVDGDTVKDTIALHDSTLANEMERLINAQNHKPAKRVDTVFNAKGNPTLVKLSDDIFGASFQRFEYDGKDQLIRITGYDQQDRIKPFYHDIAIQLNTYDPKGNLIEIRNLGEDEQLISSAFEDTPVIKMKYNAKNQLIEKWFLDENENLRSEFAIVKFDYDGQGNQIREGWFNEKGESK